LLHIVDQTGSSCRFHDELEDAGYSIEGLANISAYADRDSEFGYGYMWWVWEGEKVRYPFKGAYTACGFRGQYITIIPLLKMVVAHKSLPLGEAI